MARKEWNNGEEVTYVLLNDMVNRAMIDDATGARPATDLINGMHFYDTTLKQMQGYASAIGSWVPLYAVGTAGRVGGEWSQAAGTAAVDTVRYIAWGTEVLDTHGFLAADNTTGTAIIVPTGSGVFLEGRYRVTIHQDFSGDPNGWNLGVKRVSGGVTQLWNMGAADGAYTPSTEERAWSISLRLKEADQLAVWYYASAVPSYTASLSIDRIGA